MDESEKLMALKKAYAEIILNTAKEAAARILVSERNALRFQRELFSTKDEAFRMLLRLKQMLDSKAGEAKMISLTQQKKIDELEAQLQEAEDIVKDLREELSEVQGKLEKATNNQARPLDGQRFQLNSQVDVVATDERSSISNQAYGGIRCYGATDYVNDHYHVHNPNFAPLVMRSKEPELYKNGCTQRIRAFGSNVLDEKLSFSGVVDDAKIAAVIRGDGEGKGMCKMPKPKVDNMHGVEKNPEELKLMEADGRPDGCHNQVPAFKSFQKKRKRAARFRRSKASSCRYLPYQFTDDASNKFEDEIREVTASVLTRKLLTDPTEMSKQSRCAKVTENNAEFVRLRADKGKTFIEESELIRHESLSPESLEALACKTDVEKDSRPLDKPDTKADLDDGTASEPANSKFLKYTFSRKRKKESFSNSGRKSLLENDTSERKKGEEQNGSLVPQSSSLESSRDSRRLAQVARQLISLSEKKWWQ